MSLKEIGPLPFGQFEIFAHAEEETDQITGEIINVVHCYTFMSDAWRAAEATKYGDGAVDKYTYENMTLEQAFYLYVLKVHHLDED